MGSKALSDKALEVNRRVRHLLRQTIAEQGLKEIEVARRLGKRPDWLYKRFTTYSATLRLSFCVQVLLACQVRPGEFFHRALCELEGKPYTPPKPRPGPTQEEIRREVEPLLRDLLEDGERSEALEAKKQAHRAAREGSK